MGQCLATLSATGAPPEIQTPDENGLYPTPDTLRKWAKLTLKANVSIHVCQMFNEEAIFNKFAGQPIDALPYPPLEEWRKWAEKLDMGANVSIFMRQRFNQAAIFANL